MIRSITAAIAALATAFASPVLAQENRIVTYEVREGDTLNNIARQYLTSAAAIPEIQRINNVPVPRLMPIGKKLKIPRRLLLSRPVAVRVAFFSGPVLVAGQQPVKRQVLSIGKLVETGRNGFVTFDSDFGGRISVPSNSKARLKRARRYVLNDMLEVDFEILEGRGSASSRKLKPVDELRMRTPRAVTAVRGTDFRVGYDPARDSSLTEVVEGVVAVKSGADQLDAQAGFGVATSADGLAEPESLLPAPKIQNPGIQTNEQLRFQVEPSADAQGYRFQIATDADFLDVVAGKVVDGNIAVFDSIANRNYYVRARAISVSGLEGFAASTDFRRKRLGVDTQNGPAQILDGLLFKWLPEGTDKATYAFQMWREGSAGTPTIDETGLSTTAIVLTDIEPGNYEWRVAAIEAEQEGLLKVWGPAKKLTVSN